MWSARLCAVVAWRQCHYRGGHHDGGVVLESNSPQRTLPEAPVRKLKIEADGDFWKGLTKPKIRLVGRWLERAGFSPGQHVHVLCVAPGVIELRSANAFTVNETNQSPSEEPNRLF